MQATTWLPLSSALVLILSGCANNKTAGNDPLGTGPFDANGTYHEEWANDPSKWSRPGKRNANPPADEVPVIAKNDQPPPDANPLAPRDVTPVVRDSHSHKSSTTTRNKTKKSSETTVAKSTESTSKSSGKKSSNKSSVAKSKKSSSSRYTVKSGDSLYVIARRNGTSVAAIQRANDLSGTMIHPGQKLVVPKR